MWAVYNLVDTSYKQISSTLHCTFGYLAIYLQKSYFNVQATKYDHLSFKVHEIYYYILLFNSILHTLTLLTGDFYYFMKILRYRIATTSLQTKNCLSKKILNILTIYKACKIQNNILYNSYSLYWSRFIYIAHYHIYYGNAFYLYHR